jgi:hypothetical protein
MYGYIKISSILISIAVEFLTNSMISNEHLALHLFYLHNKDDVLSEIFSDLSLHLLQYYFKNGIIATASKITCLI